MATAANTELSAGEYVLSETPKVSGSGVLTVCPGSG